MEYVFEKIYVPNKHSFITRELELQKNSSRVHSHKNFELNFILSGNGRRIVGNNISSFDDNDLVLLGPNLPHCWEITNTKGNDTPKCIVIHFYENLITSDFFNKPELESIVELLKQAEAGIFFYGSTVEKVKQLLKRLTTQKGLRSYIELLHIFDLLVNCDERELLSNQPIAISGFDKDIEQINKINEYVFKHMQEDIKLNEIASLLNMAPGSFCRFFKKKTKLTFIEYVTNIKIGYASKLLAETDKQVIEICYECGYNNQANFNHYFKKIMKKTPSDYRKEFR
jgi:AraC-like DNA-binding protein